MKKSMRIVVTIILGFIIIGALTDNDLVLSEKVEKTLSVTELTVFQVVRRDGSLVKSGKFPNTQNFLLLHDEEDLYYDGQKIKVTKDKIIKQVGTFQYITRAGFVATVPAIRIESKNNAKK